MRVKKLVGVFVALAITLMTAVIAVPSAAASAADEQFANRLYVLINDYRQQHGLAPLRLDPQMSADSQSWTQQSADIANTAGAGSFQHSPGSYAFYENIVWNMSADSAFQSWVNSAPHRANMLKAGATDIGIGAVELTAGPNRGTFLATAQFGWSKAPADAAAQAATLEAQRVAAEKAAAEQKAAADKAAADKATADKAAADKAAADKAAAAQAIADKAAADKAAADKAAADKAAADAANVVAPAAEEPAAPEPVQNETEQDKAAKDQAAQEAALKAANEAAAVKAAEDEAARQAELKVAADAAVAEQLAAEQAAAEAAAAETAAVEAAAAQAVEAEAAAQAAASKPAASRGISRGLQNPVTVLSSLDQVVLGDESLLTSAARGTVMATAAGSQLRISGAKPGSAVDAVIPSAGVNLGTVTADAKGELKLSVPPVLAAGEHKVALFTDGGLTGWASFTVEPAVTVLAAQSVQAGSGAELAVTGLNPAQIAIGGIGALMALIGAVALIAVQRQRTISAR
ncbi:CAP domain-containing protein [Arthrobacter sp. zg-ZUI100]|uniref:CAP domain-containing protein n=1 Tax=Arthrobacter jiangjiafuii TaxID=2817475 RepID=UPI001AED4B4C|nr:CAP domain-containing protein [Arthrobacter jiangjiafuii]MBP3035137.1 CAP domain-containing protein [Arthrobacter jiangjiafuii]